MPVSFNLLTALDASLREAAAKAGFVDSGLQPRGADRGKRHGDFQANGALAYAKANRLNPRQVAEKLIEFLPAEVRQQFESSIAGAGFINFTARPELLLAWLRQFDSAARLSAGAAEFRRGRPASSITAPRTRRSKCTSATCGPPSSARRSAACWVFAGRP
jgi:arginyl-tRNA synthetase